MKFVRLAVGMATVGLLVLLSALPAGAVGSVTMTTPPAASISSWSLNSTGANSSSGGTMTLNATAPYTVTVTADKTTMSEWDGSAYVSSGKTLATPLTVSTSRTGGTATIPAVGAAVTVTTTAGTLVVGTGVGTDTFSVSLSQPTAITDSALVIGHSYHIVLTYTEQLSL